MSTMWLRVTAMQLLQLPGQVGKLIGFSDNEYHVADVMAMPGLQLPGQVGKLIEFSDNELQYGWEWWLCQGYNYQVR